MEFRRLEDGDSAALSAFIAEHGYKALDMKYSFEVYGLRNNKHQKRSGDFYGYFDDENKLTGAYVFTNKRLMSGYFLNKDVLKRVDFLKAIKHYSPLCVVGVKECVDPVFDLLHRSLKSFVYDPCYFMQYVKGVTERGQEAALVQAKDYDFKRAIDFLIEAEMAFGRNPKIINNLKQEIWEEAKASELFFLIENDRIVAQGAIELETTHYAQIGGLYTSRSHRRHGYGQVVMEALVDLIIQRHKIPVLYVSKKNAPAVELYKKMGFEVVSDCLSLLTEL